AGEEPGIQILISLLIPFAAYLAAEQLAVSGILAAATAGMTMHYVELTGPPLGATRMQRRVVWDTVQLALNGTIFVLLGQQLPRILNRCASIASQASIRSPWRLVGYALTIAIAMTALRMIWVWASLSVTLFRQRRPLPQRRAFIGVVGVSAFAGVRGALTL